MFFSVLTFTFSTGAQATKLLKSFFNSNVTVVVRENEVSLIVVSPYKNVITIGKDTCSRWDVLPELFNRKEEGAHCFTIDKIDHVVTAVQSMNKTSAITIAFVSRWDTIVSSPKFASHLAMNLRITNPKMVFTQACDEPHQIMLLGDELKPAIPVKTHLAVNEYPVENGHYLGMFAARRKINKTSLTQGICNLRFYVDGDVRSFISKEPEVQRDEAVFFNMPVPPRVLQMLVAQCTIEKDAVANMKYVPGSIVAEISCSSSFISSIFIPIEDDLNKFLEMSVGYLNDLVLMRENISCMAINYDKPLAVATKELSTFVSLEKLDEDLLFIREQSPSFAQYIRASFANYDILNGKFTEYVRNRIDAIKKEAVTQDDKASF